MEKKLAAKNKGLESMTLSCQKLQDDHRSLRDQNEALNKKVASLTVAVECKEEENKELRVENKAHIDSMKVVSQMNKVISNDEEKEKVAETELQKLKNELISANQTRDQLKKTHTKTVNGKNEEIMSLKVTISVLEENLRLEQENNTKVSNKLKLNKAEMKRQKEIDELLTEKVKNTPKCQNRPSLE